MKSLLLCTLIVFTIKLPDIGVKIDAKGHEPEHSSIREFYSYGTNGKMRHTTWTNIEPDRYWLIITNTYIGCTESQWDSVTNGSYILNWNGETNIEDEKITVTNLVLSPIYERTN